MANWLPVLVIMTLGMGALLLALSRHEATVVRLAKVSSVSLALLSTPLLLLGHCEAAWRVAWLPGLEPAGLVLHAPGIHLAVAVFWSLAVTSLFSHQLPLAGGRSLWPALSHLFCGLVVVALTIDQFLVRYAVLELVVLGTILIMALSDPLSPKSRGLWWLYAQFRLGDAGLVAAILLLYRGAGTLNISRMLAFAATMPAGGLMPIVVAMLLAIWVKMGLPPFHHWLLDTRDLPWDRRLWATAAGPPLLGAYLLYRLAPLLGSLNAHASLAVVGWGLMIWSLLSGHRSSAPSRRISGFLVAHSALGLALAGSGAMPYYLLSFLLVRGLICILAARAVRAADLAQQGERLRAGNEPTAWVAVGRHEAGPDAQGPPDASSRRAGHRLLSLASRVALTVEENLLEGFNRSIARLVGGLARLSRTLVEDGLLEGINRLVAHQMVALGRLLQDAHLGRLRRNLQWTGIALLAVIAVTIVALTD